MGSSRIASTSQRLGSRASCLAKSLGIVVSGIVAIGVLTFAWRSRRTTAASSEFIQTLAAWFLAATLILPVSYPFNQALIILPALMVVRDWSAALRIGRRVFATVVPWSWVTSLALLLAPPRLNTMSPLPLLPSAISLLVPFVLAILLATNRFSSIEQPPADITLLFLS